MKNKFLIIVCCGDESKHLSYSMIPNNIFFDVLCIYYGSNDTIMEKYKSYSKYFKQKNK